MRRSISVGTMLLAGEFLDAAASLNTPGLAVRSGRDPLKVRVFLYGHALELMAKATLICAGTHERRLRQIGHDLTAAFRAVRRQPGTVPLPLANRDFTVIGLLNSSYEQKDFEYLAVGFRRYPLLNDVRDLAHRLHAHLSPAISAAVRAWFRASR